MIELARHRMMMGGSAKPYDAEVEWIQMSAAYGSYTQFTPIHGYIDVKASINNIGSTNNYSVVLQLGNFNSSARRTCRYAFYRNMNSKNIIEDNINAAETVGTADGTYITRTNIRYDSSDAPSRDYGKLSIRGESTDILTLCYMRFRDWFGNTIHDYIPVRVGNVGRLYDRVQGIILPSTNMTITPGPDKTV